jgi:isoleucyl-tRNA synthetase
MAVPSWFIRVEEHRDALCKSNADTYWVPNHVKEKRFHNWLANARDWSISRNRYWGTPLPIWQSPDCEEVICIGSVEELEKLSGVRVTDLHREHIDDITIPSARPGMPPLKRVSEVFDCWFESGSMPYAQAGYPFKQDEKAKFEATFPANFIAEGVDQTRGWFYSLTVIGTLLYGQAPFKNVIVNGLVQAKDGTKMSKRKLNYTSPDIIINKYGADAVRLYLINSPVVRAEDLKFKDDGVKDVCKDVFLPWFNAYRFLLQNVILYQNESGKKFELTKSHIDNLDNFMDKWILSELGSLVDFVKVEMKALRLYTVVPRLVNFFGDLTNWYVRLNRARLRGELGEQDAENALATLTNVLYILSRRMAPCTPFLSEYIYQGIRPIISDELLGSDRTDSVHFMLVPSAKECGTIDETILASMRALQNVVELARVARERRVLAIRQPLEELVVIHESEEVLTQIQSLETYIKSELNIKNLTTSTDKAKYNVRRTAKPDVVKLGKRLRKAAKPVQNAVREMSGEQVEFLINNGSIELAGEVVELSEVFIEYKAGEADQSADSKYEVNSSGGYLVLLDALPSENLIREGQARDIINRIQQAKKSAKLVPTDQVQIVIEDLSKQKMIQPIAQDFFKMIQAQVRSELAFDTKTIKNDEIHSEEANLGKDKNFNIKIYGEKRLNSDIPLVMVGENTVLLENPKGVKLVSDMSDLEKVVESMMGVSLKSAGLDEVKGNQIFKVDDCKVVSSKDMKMPGKIVTVHSGKQEFYVLMENAGSKINSVSELVTAVESLVLCPDQEGQNKVTVYSDAKKTKVVEGLKFDDVYV